MSYDSAILNTPRLTLHPCTTNDTDALHDLWTRPEVRKYLWDDVVITMDQCADVIASSIEDFSHSGYGHWVIKLRGQSDLIGWCGFRQFEEGSKTEILYGILPELWGQGLAVEASRAILQYGFNKLGLEKIYAGTDPPNLASIRVMEKLGMRFDERKNTNGLEAIYYVLTKAEFLL